ncbi:CIA30 family protein [Kovacikia minuta CCNUW1]|uniref:CIA30 family protein n=1 Tax=Kovacikia minuta TaxID=2931930 RepID=UPI001CCC49D3|nr:CIA30 family protein [Kovacikia minuta]UBF25273.1 CIA30 family protein [Kovacikia minuta CCNUW1]
MTQSTRRQWDAGRFFQTLNYFETIPVISWLQKMVSGSTPPPPPHPQAGVLFDFSQPDRDLSQTWGALDDVVMGGVSASSLQLQEGAAVFTGDVSTANSGGFASVRTRNFEPPLNLWGYSGIELRVKGDGQRYKFLIRDEDTWDSVGYSYSFDTIADEWISVPIPFTQLIPVFRAKTVANARPLNTAQIRSFQVMLSKFEYDGALNPHFKPGTFRLLLGAIATQ